MPILPEITEAIRELLSLKQQANDTNAALRETNQLSGQGGSSLSSAGQFQRGSSAEQVTGRRGFRQDTEEDEPSGFKPGKIKRGLRRIGRTVRAAIGLYELENLADAANEFLYNKNEVDYQREQELLNDTAKFDPNTGLMKQPVFQKLQLAAKHDQETAERKIQFIESLSYFAGPAGRLAAFIGGTVARLGLKYSEHELERAENQSQAGDIFRQENLVTKKGPRHRSRSEYADDFIKAGGDVKLLKEDIERIHKHQDQAYKMIEMGDTARAQFEYDQANKVASGAGVVLPAYWSPVDQYLAMDRARGAIRLYSMYQQMAPNLRTGE